MSETWGPPNASISDLYSERGPALPSYSDQVLPMNVILATASEILNEGTGICLDDAVTKSRTTFVACAIETLQAIVSPSD